MLNRGACDYCGAEHPLDDLVEVKGDHYCSFCYTEWIVEKADEYHICSNCNGSGEGMYEGTRCWQCHGRGEV